MGPGGLGKSFRVGRILGIPITVHWSLVILAAFTVLLGAREGSAGIEILVAILGIASVLAHELAHAITAKILGHRTLSIELHAFGGLASIQGEMRDSHDLLVSLAGPASTLCLSALSMGLSHVAPGTTLPVVFTAISWWNLALGLFNLVPALPLDGGRVLASWYRARSDSALEGASRAYAVGWWTSLIGVALSLWGGSFIATFIFVQAFATCHAGFIETLERLGYRPPRPGFFAWLSRFLPGREKRVEEQVRSKLREITERHRRSTMSRETRDDG